MRLSLSKRIQCLFVLLVAGSNLLPLSAQDAVSEAPQEPEPDFSNTDAIRIENGIHVLSSLEGIQDLFRDMELSEDVVPSSLSLVLLFDPECPHTEEMVHRLEESYEILMDYFDTTTDDLQNFSRPFFAKMSISDVSKEVLGSLGVTSVPSLLLVRNDGGENTFMLEYTGLRGSARDIFQTFWHYYYCLIVKPESVVYTQSSIDVYPRQFLDLKEAMLFVRDHRQYLFDSSNELLTFPPSLSDSEVGHIHWLLQEQDGEGHLSDRDDFLLFVQCRPGSADADDNPNKLYSSFDSMSQVLTNRRDLLFSTNVDCSAGQSDGSVTAWKIPMDYSFEHLGGNPDLLQCTSPTLTNDQAVDAEKLVEFMVKVATPSVLWFDRQATAPIAFPLYRQVHAVLFVDLHHIPSIPSDPGSDPKSLLTRFAVRQFRKACRDRRKYGLGGNRCSEEDLVCLIIPSTETRVMTTFGIDMWSPLDRAIHELAEEEPPLPTLLLTDQRSGGTLRYYLGAEAILDESASAIPSFIQDFWAGSLLPRVKSSSNSRTTESGVQILTANTMKEALHLESGSLHHALLYFTAPTCGHCKRFSTVWKQLADLLHHVDWMHFVKLYQVDVTTDDIAMELKNVTVQWLPDLYYLSPDRQSIIRYDDKDSLGDDVGKISSPMDILSWFIAKGEFENEQVEKLLQDLEERF